MTDTAIDICDIPVDDINIFSLFPHSIPIGSLIHPRFPDMPVGSAFGARIAYDLANGLKSHDIPHRFIENGDTRVCVVMDNVIYKVSYLPSLLDMEVAIKEVVRFNTITPPPPFKVLSHSLYCVKSFNDYAELTYSPLVIAAPFVNGTHPSQELCNTAHFFTDDEHSENFISNDSGVYLIDWQA